MKLERACYKGLTEQERERIEVVLDEYKVVPFRDFATWSFSRNEQGYWIDRTTWENPTRKDSIDDVVQLLENYYK